MEGLKNNSIITKEQASFFIGSTDQQSYVDIGAYDLSSVKGGSESNIQWMNMINDTLFWASYAVQGVKIGNEEFTPEGMTAQIGYGDYYSDPAIYDTGTSLIYTPYGTGNDLVERLT